MRYRFIFSIVVSRHVRKLIRNRINSRKPSYSGIIYRAPSACNPLAIPPLLLIIIKRISKLCLLFRIPQSDRIIIIAFNDLS